MSSDTEKDDASGAHTRDSQSVIDAVLSSRSLSELAELIGADSEHEAYFEAKEVWREHTDGWFESSYGGDGTLPGDLIVIDGHEFHVHGVTHAGTVEEREFLREHVSRFHGRGATVYCEQGIRSMYFKDFPVACEMDDYTWSVEKAKKLGVEEPVCDAPPSEFEGSSNLDGLKSRLRDSVFALVESGTRVYGDRFGAVLGDVASGFLTSHVDASKGDDFESFRLTREVARNPERLGELQAYYRRNLLPQPLESDWMCRHDPEIEIFTHARNERMADYAVYHNEEDEEVHLIVGAAHQPGVVYYLEQHRDGKRSVDGFELFG